MSELSKAKITNGRAPSFNALCKAYQKFFEARAEEPGIITEFHAKQLVTTYDYLRKHKGDGDVDSKGFEIIESKDFMELTLYVLSQANCHGNSHQYIRRIANNAYRVLSAAATDESSEISSGAFLAWIRINAFYGNPYQARTALVKEWPKVQQWPDVDAQGSPWLWILHGMALDQNATELVQAVQDWDMGGYFTLTPQQHQDLVITLLEQGQLAAAKIMHDCPLPAGEPTVTATSAVARAYILNDDKPGADELINRLSVHSPSAETRDIFLLIAAANGKDAQGLDRELNNWCLKDPSVREGLSISCVNDLIRYAYVTGNKSLAVDYSSLISTWGLESNSETQLLLELEPRIQDSDIDGTVKALNELDESEASANIALRMRYRLIKMLCSSPNNDEAFDQVSKLLDPLLQDGIQLEPEILTVLSRALAYRHDWEALSQLLRPRIGSYSMRNERPLIQNALVDFIRDTEQENEEVWEAYDLLRIAFPEISAERRVEIMDLFFTRGMVEEACQVFGHMRHAPTPAQRPTPEAYITCFLGLARATAWDNTKLIRNMLKVDVDIEITTRVRNSVMLALAACERSEEAMDEFREILRSDEGPSQNTLIIFFRACESAPNGVAEANKMLTKITALEIPLDRGLYLAYIKALAAQGEHELAIEALEQTENKIGQRLDKDMIARIYNSCAHEYAKEGIQQWTVETHPTVWQELENLPRTETETGLRLQGFEDDLAAML
ncbi:mitochondrial respiratory complex I chaperone (Cia84), putative [Talaromyces stipitatus ATCC 10500]|uniref:Mitochondrial respiratory complex I chaperone (Cia84), putative n=1 Tax=Talaromyces stipitatus (strain ATCC 10500 / CBS 375.48 / QM 6759 / NRRL 1006) TaxID=441959 RepID=B8LT74_TALSN|nr:mitochondrial respiratory complex I chaperone (Cia84), putative [Talaromyces stipitatus ATCC 10500]EED23582.1 mitochondrial respiratory complex I chaperone (Cia84), putative [Talaromyces stipitatus ATCC 10500]